jgi:hypothetical protein
MLQARLVEQHGQTGSSRQRLTAGLTGEGRPAVYL